MAGYGAGGRYVEETEPTSGKEERPDGMYPGGRNGGVTGALSGTVPGSREVVKARGATKHVRSAGQCADHMAPAGTASMPKGD